MGLIDYHGPEVFILWTSFLNIAWNYVVVWCKVVKLTVHTWPPPSASFPSETTASIYTPESWFSYSRDGYMINPMKLYLIAVQSVRYSTTYTTKQRSTLVSKKAR